MQIKYKTHVSSTHHLSITTVCGKFKIIKYEPKKTEDIDTTLYKKKFYRNLTITFG